MGGLRGALVSGYAFIFPGQGSQLPGMGRALFDAYPESREIFREADDILGTSLSSICFEGTESELARTEATQPAILTVSVAASRALTARGLVPSAAAGHSLGEYSAHVAAGTFSFADAVRSVRLRGRLMQEAVPLGQGAMAAIIGLDPAALERICQDVAGSEIVSIANLNSPGQNVIAGHVAAVARAVERSLDSGAARAVQLNVSAPFHCRLMEPAAQRLAVVLGEFPFCDPAIRVFTNVDASEVREAETARHTLIRQVVSPVRWQEIVEKMVDSGITTFVEVGPGRVLAGLVRRIRHGARVLAVADPDGVERALREIGKAA